MTQANEHMVRQPYTTVDTYMCADSHTQRETPSYLCPALGHTQTHSCKHSFPGYTRAQLHT